MIAMKRKTRVHMLPAKEATPHGLTLEEGKLKTYLSEVTLGIHKRKIEQGIQIPQYLYLTSDEEVKEGDWWLSGNGSYGVRKCVKVTPAAVWDDTGEYALDTYDIRKVIATTDPTLIADGIAKLSQDFVKKFVELYNTGTPIKECLVEYEQVVLNTKPERVFDVVLGGYDLVYKPNEFVDRPKLNSSGEVIIHPIKERMYTRAELKQACSRCWTVYQASQKPTMSFDQWFAKNYPEL